MHIYHFVPASYGLENLRLRRLKIATIQELNDPFELLCVDLSNHDLRAKMQAWKLEIAKRFGMICFSRTWRNPVQWSHYADKHRGLCLGFDVSDDSVRRVTYSGRRSNEDVLALLAGDALSEEAVLKFLSTKYAHWCYEQEMRTFPRLEKCDPTTKLFFADFSDQLKLTEVIVGAESEISRSELESALGELVSNTLVRKAMLSFKSFRVTTQVESNW